MSDQLFSDLVAGMDANHLAQFLGITKRTLNRWKSGQSQPPQSALLALRMHLYGDLQALGGKEWHGFALRRGKLYAPFHLRPFDPFQIQAMFFEVQAARSTRLDLDKLQRENAQLLDELKAHRSRAWASDKLLELVK